MSEWKKKELWHRRGEGFCVEVSHHKSDVRIDDSEGPNRWCVYAYIYPKHPHFKNFEGDSMWQDAASTLPLHGGPSFLRDHFDAQGNITSIQVGSDYHHLHDESYTHMDTEEDARSVFCDADELVERLSKQGTPDGTD